MAEDIPRAFFLRVFPVLLILAVTMATTMAAPGANAQTSEGSLRIVPAISSVDTERGPFTVFIVLQDLEHYGALQYDDDRDTVPDREVESVGLAAFEFTIQYDPLVLAVAGAERGPDLDRTGRTFQCLTPAEELGSFRFGCISMGSEPPGLQGSLTLASVTFQPLKPGSSALLLEAELAGPLGADQVPVDVRGGVARVTGQAVATATGALPGRNTGTPGSRPGGSDETPSPAGTAPASTEPAAAAEGETPQAATTSAAEGGGNPTELAVRGEVLEAEKEGAAADEGSASSAALWWGAALGGLTVAVALALAAVFWWRRGFRGRA